MKKKIIVCIMSLVLVVGILAGCNGGSKFEVPEGAPDYSAHLEEKVMPIGGWNPPAHSKENYQTMKEAGFNFLHNVNWYGGDIEQNMEWLAELGMQGYLQLQGEKYTNYKGDFTKLSSFEGFNFFDEPNVKQIGELAKQVAGFKKDHPGKRFLVNLFPNYASASQLGAESFQAYVDEFVAKIDSGHISYDFYPLLGNNFTSSVHAQYLQSLEIMGIAARDTNRDFWAFMQSMSYGSNRRLPRNSGDIRFQVYTNFAYGVNGIQYFCYATPPIGTEFTANDFALIDRDNKKTVIYDYVKEVNEEILAFDHVLLSFDWVNTMTVNGSNNQSANTAFIMLKNSLTQTDLFTNVSASEDSLISVFRDNDDKYNGYMLVNYSDPGKLLSSDISLKFNGGANKAIVYEKGVEKTVDLTDGVYSCKLESGEGRFVIPFKG